MASRRRAKISGQNVKSLRKQFDLTQRDLAEKAQVEQRTVARWEQEKDGLVIGDVDFIVWAGILNLFGLPAEWLPGDPVPLRVVPSVDGGPRGDT